jgi:hypothetical protein
MEEPTGDGEDENAASAVQLALLVSVAGGEGESARASEDEGEPAESQGIYIEEESCVSLRAKGYVFPSPKRLGGGIRNSWRKVFFQSC